MKILPKELLSIADVATYLNNVGFDYDLNQPMSYKKLLLDIFELNVQQNIPILFRYSGDIESHIDIYTYIEVIHAEGAIPVNVDRLVTPAHASGAFYLDNRNLRKILIEQEDLQLESFFTPVDNRYIVSTLQEDLFIDKYKESHEIRQIYFIDTSDHLKVEDLLIPIGPLNTLFKIQVNTGTSLENCLKSQVADLKLEAEQLNEELAEAKKLLEIQEQTIRTLKDELEQSKSDQFDTFHENEANLKKTRASKNQDDKIVVYLAFILAQRSAPFSKKDGSINAEQVGKAINSMAQCLGLKTDDMHGFKRPDARLRTLINNNKELLLNFEKLVKAAKK